MTKPKSTNAYIHCRVTQAIATGLQQAATDDDRSLSYIMRKAFEEYLQAHGYAPRDV